MTDPEMNPFTQTEGIDQIVAYAKGLPDFPNKALIVQRLETGNINRYQEAMLNINEVIAQYDTHDTAHDTSATKEQLQGLLDRITALESQDTFDQG